ncbi:MAG: tripartite tricarboxylate transporter TctB family protein [Proteobacteria bacterium]|nr:tripartite tricarboxylate transporter TctB family protein [Burkholderiales bacterium]
MEIVVAALFFAFAAVVMFDSYRLGAAWGSDGPEPGYFPFYTGLIIAIASVVLLVQGVRLCRQPRAAFVERGQFKDVLVVLLPALGYVLAIEFVGIYLASACYIAVFMVFLGHYTWKRGVTVGVSVGLFAFVLFERWFSIPLPKGFIERALGF